MLKLKQQKRIFNKTEKGMAFVESIPVLFMVVVVFNFSMGFFGAIHSGILNSIGSYNYAMETYRFRSNLMYFRPGGGMKHYKDSMNRVHGVTADGVENDDLNKKVWPATVRNIAFAKEATKLADGTTYEGNHKYSDSSKNSPSSIWGITSDYRPDSGTPSAETSEIWVKTVYGICLNAECKAVN